MKRYLLLAFFFFYVFGCRGKEKDLPSPTPPRPPAVEQKVFKISFDELGDRDIALSHFIKGVYNKTVIIAAKAHELNPQNKVTKNEYFCHYPSRVEVNDRGELLLDLSKEGEMVYVSDKVLYRSEDKTSKLRFKPLMAQIDLYLPMVEAETKLLSIYGLAYSAKYRFLHQAYTYKPARNYTPTHYSLTEEAGMQKLSFLALPQELTAAASIEVIYKGKKQSLSFSLSEIESGASYSLTAAEVKENEEETAELKIIGFSVKAYNPIEMYWGLMEEN